MRILVLAGGSSSERKVSLDTGRAISEGLKRLGHDLLVMDPATGQSLLDSDGNYIANSQADSASGALVPLVKGLSELNAEKLDLVFLALHGGEGENGSIQNLLDLCGMTYTGSSMTASAVSMNKAIAKRLFGSVGVRTPEWKLYHVATESDIRKTAEDIASEHCLPIIVKPNNGGSTVGLSKVNRPEGIPDALRLAIKEDSNVLVERYISGRELTVAVLDRHTFPVVEIRPKNELYDYEAKYTKGKSDYIAPAEVPEELAARLQEDALKVFDVVGASGLTRVDFLWSEPGEHYCLEINTLPGMTSLSLAPMAAACEGIKFDRLLELIIESALRKE